MNTATMRPRFDPVVNWGHVLVLVAMVASAIGLYVGVQRTLTEHAFRIAAVERMASDQVALARGIEAQLVAIREDLAALKAITARRADSPQ